MASSSTELTLCHLQPGLVDLPMLRNIYQGNVRLELAEEARADVQASQETVTRIVESGKVVYGINTGFGKLAQTSIPTDRLAELQRNLVLSHSVGIGKDLADDVVRLVMATKVISLCARAFRDPDGGYRRADRVCLTPGCIPASRKKARWVHRAI